VNPLSKISFLIYRCFYFGVLTKSFRHERALFLLSLTAGVYAAAFYIALLLYFKLFFYFHPMVVAVSLGLIAFLTAKFLERRLNKRTFYAEAVRDHLKSEKWIRFTYD
jgi:hypothetical protein